MACFDGETMMRMKSRGQPMERPFKSFLLSTLGAAVGVALLVFVICPPGTHADQIPAGWEASNMKPIGYSDMDGHGGAFKMAIRHIGDKWYLYTGHLWNRGWSIVDVTDPANPKYVKFVPWPQDNTWTI